MGLMCLRPYLMLSYQTDQIVVSIFLITLGTNAVTFICDM